MDDPLTSEEADAIIDKVVERISRKKMEVPALLFFETHKPLSYVGSQFTVAMSPFIVPFFGYDRTRDAIRLLSKREYVDRLVNRLESSAQARNRRPAPELN
ncbi:MAG: hypothetical protein JSS72_08445 [Armatimonadetes bacterium]|nr:hypothetical protein [Armatimonadota bacterium]